ncbi:GNAT family N-acetyltransferase [Allosaccharopolyspora coralli]|uniref:GNAT family N-acetyltransferase n=1 Tax=Allosaccharopolyspora coralli TaxID=2665642 RepID=A0A5Q3Q631_9PSEU|nr:GNAT family N-acetyltransferase [Allosaccharopolyspora coralli]QGK69803.1 GNAT family N-acetyltransferase [Allosaccharopolyspora coralli]
MGVDVRALDPAEYRAAQDVFMAALMRPPTTDEQWRVREGTIRQGDVLGGFHDGTLAGTTRLFGSTLRVPGGAAVPAGAVTAVGVRADKTRRGVLTALMRAQLTDAKNRGHVVAMLHASEAAIYGRFGYGAATRARQVRLTIASVKWRDDMPRGGAVRLVDRADAEKLLPELYRRIGTARPGMMERSDGWWRVGFSRHEQRSLYGYAVHSDEHGDDDGYALYHAVPLGGDDIKLQVHDLVAATSTAAAELWRFLTGIDLATEIEAARPVDEPLEWWLQDARQCRTVDVFDDLWVRLVDVPAALHARTFGGSTPVVIEVRDRILPQNDGVYRIGSDGAERSERSPQLVMDVESLGALYLGDVSVSTVAAANRVEVRDPAALEDADAVFTTPRQPWCGTHF